MPFCAHISLDISNVNCIVTLITPVIIVRFIQVNKTVKSLIRYHTIMLRRENAIIKLHQMNVIEIRKQCSQAGGRKINKDIMQDQS